MEAVPLSGQDAEANWPYVLDFSHWKVFQQSPITQCDLIAEPADLVITEKAISNNRVSFRLSGGQNTLYKLRIVPRNSLGQQYPISFLFQVKPA